MKHSTRLLALSAFAFVISAQPQSISNVRQSFQTPPPDARPMVRWWWFGAAVTKPELEREIVQMKADGFGGFEVQPVYPLTLDDPAHNLINLPYMSDGFLDALRFVAQVASREHMRFDLTLCSGWPY
ncbi:MAG TPA: glycosyl hydrolase, partial [Verrucomicrobiae bacterium]|nr:glycosyl hydrolase [Verrucomicrobiae bacterium]